MLKEGCKAPDFSLASSHGDLIALSQYVGKKVILYFYPKDSTPGCIIEARDFENLRQDFLQINTYILGVSKDSIESHNKFAARQSLSFPLLSDDSGCVAKIYGVLAEKSMFGKKYMGVNRTTFLINEDGNIVKIWDNVSIRNHAADVLSFILAM